MKGIPVWVWPIVAMLALAWIRVLLPGKPKDGVAPDPRPRMPPQAPAVPSAAPAPPAAWTVEFLLGLPLNRLELLVQRYWSQRGCTVERARTAGGEIELLISRPSTGKLFALAQCAAARRDKTGADAVRALLASGAQKSAGVVVLYGLPGFTEEAQALAKGQSVKLVDAAALLGEIRGLSSIQQQRLLEQTLIASGPALARG